MNWEVVNDIDQAKIKVIGVGGAGLSLIHIPSPRDLSTSRMPSSA